MRDPDAGLVVHRQDGWKPPLALPRGDEFFDWTNMRVFDCEATGLLNQVGWHLHCGWTFDPVTGIYRGYRPDQMERMADDLSKVQVVAHNGLGYDFLAMRKAFPGWECVKEIDTLVLVKMLWALDDLIDKDMILWRRGQMPGGQMKRQGIEAWGYRLGQMKGDYSADRKAEYIANGGDPRDREAMMNYTWGTFNEPMFTYNKQDVVVNWAVLLKCCQRMGWFQDDASVSYRYPAMPANIEHQMQRICLAQEAHGLGFNRDKAVILSGELLKEREAIEDKVASIFRPWFQPKGDVRKGTIAPATVRRKQLQLPDVTIPRFSEKTGKALKPYVGPPMAETIKGAAFVPIVYTEFSLRNRHHLANRLQVVYGWKPKAFGGAKGTDPVIDEDTLKGIPDNVLAPALKKLILDYYVIDKTYSTLAGGTKAWLTLYDEVTHSIHGRCDPLGTITRRAAHNNPNLGNIPSVELDEEKDASGKVVSTEAVLGVAGGYGHECRELFGPVPAFDCQTGTDMYALELFMLGQFLYPYDGGDFARRVQDPDVDIHQSNADMIGLPRKPTKTTTYATIYGSGALGVGQQVWNDEDDIPYWADAPGVKSWVNWQQREFGDAFKKPTKLILAQYGKGYDARQKLLNGIPGLKPLIADVKAVAEKNHSIKLLDGSKVSVRKAFAALNALLQANGAIACKVWIIAMHERLKAQGLMPSILEIGTGRILQKRDWNQIAWVHDETQNEHDKTLGNAVGEASRWAATEASRRLGLRVTLRAEYKIGGNWADCH